MLLYPGTQHNYIIQVFLIRGSRAQKYKHTEHSQRHNPCHAGGDNGYRYPSGNPVHVPAVIPASINKEKQQGCKKQPDKSKGRPDTRIHNNHYKIGNAQHSKPNQYSVRHPQAPPVNRYFHVYPVNFPLFSAKYRKPPGLPPAPGQSREPAWDAARCPAHSLPHPLWQPPGP